MKQTTNVDIGDILSAAEKLGYSWNGAHQIMEDDKIIPLYDGPFELYASDVTSNAYGWSEDTLKIMAKFFEINQLESCTLLP